MHTKSLKSLIFFAVLFLIFQIGLTQDNQTSKKLKFIGDFRFRTEFDRNSRKMDGTYRDHRDRLRYRLRLGFEYYLNEILDFGGQIRTGNSKNQQSSNITIGDGIDSDGFQFQKPI